jgi:hypothetical protein
LFCRGETPSKTLRFGYLGKRIETQTHWTSLKARINANLRVPRIILRHQSTLGRSLLSVALKFCALALLMLTACAHYQAQPILLADLTTPQAKHTLSAPCIRAQHANTLPWTEAQLIGAASCFSPELARAKAALQLAAVNGDLAKQYPGLALVLGRICA